jgi:hypothetical protein
MNRVERSKLTVIKSVSKVKSKWHLSWWMVARLLFNFSHFLVTCFLVEILAFFWASLVHFEPYKGG